MFDNSARQETVSWNIIISGYIQNGLLLPALELYEAMLRREIDADKVTLLCILKACAGIGAMGEACLIHHQVIVDDLEADTVIGTTLVDLYARCASVVDARRVFDRLPHRTVVSWSAMVGGYVQQGYGFLALELYEKMEQIGLKPDKLMLTWVLKACATDGALLQGRLVHDWIIRYKMESNISCASNLAELYARCGSQEEASGVFKNMLVQDEVPWNEIMTEHAFTGPRTVEEGCPESGDLKISCIIKACGSIGALHQGRLVHQQVVKRGLESDASIGTTLIDMYARLGKLEEANSVFESLPCPDRVSWNAAMNGYVQHGCGLSALALYERMETKGILPSNVTFLCALKACTVSDFEGQGRFIHDRIVRSGFDSDITIASTLIDMYAKCGGLEEAYQVLKAKAYGNVVSWTAMITGCAQHNCARDALELFDQMQQEGILPTLMTFSSALKACGGIKSLEQGRIIHGQIVENGLDMDAGVRNLVVDLYAKCGRLNEAYEVLVKMPTGDMITWGIVIAGYVQLGDGLFAFELFKKLLQFENEPSASVFAWMIKACTVLGALELGRSLHDWVIRRNLQSDLDLGNALVEMYAKQAVLRDASDVFQKLSNKDAVSWGMIITGHTQHGLGFTALELFERMLREGMRSNEVLCASILKACSDIRAIKLGRIVHSHIIEGVFQYDVVVGNTLVNLYITCNNMEEARQVFDKLLCRDTVTWNALIAGHVRHGDGLGALDLYNKMEHIAMPDKVTFICSLNACAIVGAIDKGREIHAEVIRNDVECDVVVGTTLIDMYAKFGRVDEARQVFDELTDRNMVSWGAMVAGYARFGNFGQAGSCVEAMQKQAMEPDDRFNTIILSSCSHAGQFEEGWCHFENIVEKHDDQLNCMADILGRAGHLNEAEKLLKSVPGFPDIAGWMSLLVSCRRLGNFELGKRCFDQLMYLEPGLAGGYELMSNLYQDAHMWDDNKKTQDLRKFANAWKKPGKAWIELNQRVHEFKVADHGYTQVQGTYSKLRFMRQVLNEEGYVPKVDAMSKLALDNLRGSRVAAEDGHEWEVSVQKNIVQSL